MKTEKIQIRVSEELKKEIQKRGEKLGMNISQYLIYLHKSNINNTTYNFYSKIFHHFIMKDHNL